MADCAAFANARGGTIIVGIENDAHAPPVNQKVTEPVLNRLVRGIRNLTQNLHVVPSIITHENGGQYIRLEILPSVKSIAATTDGRYYMRVSDETRVLQPDDLVRLVSEKDSYQWESQVTRRVSINQANANQLYSFLERIRASDRVKDSIKVRLDEEILEHYFLLREGMLTNLGILWIGLREDRARLLHAPVIQFIKFDSHGQKVAKRLWDDFTLNPAEMIESVWNDIPDWKETTELPDGLFRKQVPHYDEIIIRELLANALVHRPYTTRGDIFINLFPDFLEIHNPGLLPLGVTPKNILQRTIRRNDLLAQIFHDLKLMEREGSGYDRMYEAQLLQAKAPPIVSEEEDRVIVRIERRIIKRELINLLAAADQSYNLTSRERIALGLIAQHGSLTSLEFTKLLQLESQDRARSWLGTLLQKNIVGSRGQTRGAEYFVTAEFRKAANFQAKTTLKPIQAHRLEELVRMDLELYPFSSFSAIHTRIGLEIPVYKLKKCLLDLRTSGAVQMQGVRRHSIYSLAAPSDLPASQPASQLESDIQSRKNSIE